MKQFTIHPSDTSDLDSDSWCTTTDTSIHSDLGSFMEDMALHEGDVSEIYEGSSYDDFSDPEYDDEFTSEDETEDEDGIEDIKEEGNTTNHSSDSYSSESELSDDEMFDEVKPVVSTTPCEKKIGSNHFTKTCPASLDCER